MRAKFVRGEDPRKVMEIGDYWKRAVDILVEPLGKSAIFEWDLEDTVDPEGTPTKYLRTFVKLPGWNPGQVLLKWAAELPRPEYGGPPLGPRDRALVLIEEGMKREGKSVIDEDQLFYIPKIDTFYRISVSTESGLQKIKVGPKFKPPIEKYPGDDQGVVLDMAIWYQQD